MNAIDLSDIAGNKGAVGNDLGAGFRFRDLLRQQGAAAPVFYHDRFPGRDQLRGLSGDQPFFLIVERQTVVDVIVSAKAGVAMLPPEDTPAFQSVQIFANGDLGHADLLG